MRQVIALMAPRRRIPSPADARGKALALSVAGIILAMAAVVVFWRLSLHPTDLLVGPQHHGRNDVTSQFIAFRAFQGRALAEARPLPSWNPHSLGGVPWLGSPQSAMFYPPNWMYGLFSAERAISWMLVLHHWLAGLGTFVLCRRYGLCTPAALFAGISFLGAPYYVAQTGEGHYNQVCAVAYVPWAFLALERLRCGRRGGVVATAGVLALAFFCGHVQEVFYLVLLLSTVVAADVIRRFVARGSDAAERVDSRRSAALLVGRWMLVGVSLAGLTAIELLPMWLYSRHSVRAAGMTLEQVSAGSLTWPSLLQLLDPFTFGGPANYQGPGQYYWEAVCHFGLVPLVFAIVAVCGSCRRYPVRRFAVLWLVAFLFALGRQTPVFPLLHGLVPGVALFREPSRALFFCSFLTAVLAGAGFDQMLAFAAERRSRWRRGALIAALAAVIAAALLAAFQQGGRGAIAPAGTSSVLGWQAALQVVSATRVLSWLLGALLLMFLLTLAPRLSQFAVAAGIAILCVELGWHAGQVLRTIPAAAVRRENPLVAFLQQHAGLGRVLAKQELLSDREAWAAGISKVQGYDPVPLGRSALMFAAMTRTQAPAELLVGFSDIDLDSLRKPLVDAWSARYAVLPEASHEDTDGWQVVLRGRMNREFVLRGEPVTEVPYIICENTTSLPRAYVIGKASLLDPQQDVVRQLATHNPHESVLVERDVLPAGPRQSLRPAKILHDSPSRVVIEATLEAPGYLVLSDAYYPGWTGRVDGSPARLMAANLLFRAVSLGQGTHTVEFAYVPPSAPLGAAVTALSILILAAANWRSRRSPEGHR